MCTLSQCNVKFIQNYNNVLEHHVECILNYPLALYEDKQLLKVFWNGYTLYKQRKRWTYLIFSVGCAAVGIATSIKVKNVGPFMISLLPCSFPIGQSVIETYYSHRYKSNFEKLLRSMLEGFILLWKVRAPFLKFKDLEEVGQNDRKFIKFAFGRFVECLEELKSFIQMITKLVPLNENNINYPFDNLSTLQEFRASGIVPLSYDFQQLLGDYILYSSYFLNSIGMCMCEQLWKDGFCDFKNLFIEIIPKANIVFQTALKEINHEFNKVRSIGEGSSKNVICGTDPTSQSQNGIFYPSPQYTAKTNVEKITKDCSNPYHFVSNFDDFLNLLKKRKANHKIDLSHLNSKNDQICYENVWALKEFSVSNGENSNQNKPNSHVQDVSSTRSNFDGTTKDAVVSKYRKAIMIFSKAIQRRIQFIYTSLATMDPMSEAILPNDFPRISYEDLANEESLEQSLERIGITNSPLSPALSTENNLNNDENYLKDYNNFSEAYKQSLLAESGEFHFGFNMYPDMPRPFNTTYSCYSVAMLPGNERQDVERGGKIIMPPSALEQLTRLNINYPMLFKITNKKSHCKTHCGVLEFVADEGKVYLPLWMMQNLVLEEGNLIQIESVSLPVGTFAKFQPVSSDFLDISNPKAVLENCLRTFACLTAGDVIAVTYNQKVYELNVMETKPGEAISIIECDMNVEFAAPVGYKEEVHSKPKEEDVVVDPAELMPAASGFVPFRGDGNRLDGKPRKDSASTSAAPVKAPYVKGIPDYDWEFGTLSYSRHFIKTEENNEVVEEFKPFHGKGHSLR